MRTRVRNPHRHATLFIATFFVFLASEILWRYTNVSPLDFQQFRGKVSPIALFVVFLLAPIPHFCQHFRWCAAYGAVIGAAILGIPILVDSFDGSFFALFRPVTLLGFLTVCALGAAPGAIVAVAWVAIYRMLFSKILIQDGTICPACTYCIIHLPSNVCPECGREFNLASIAEIAADNVGGAAIRTRRNRYPILAGGAWITLLIGAHFVRLTPPLYALFDGRYWRYVLASSDSERLKLRWLVSSLPAERAKDFLIDDTEVRSIMGPPDLVFKRGNLMTYLYSYTQFAGRKDEIYLHFIDGKLSGVGGNAAGVNDLSEWSPYTGAQ